MNHVTQAKRRLKTRLVDHLPALLAAADVEAADGYTTPPPLTVATNETAGTQEYPSIEMVVQNSTKQPDSTADEYQHRVVLAITIGGDDEERVTTYLERYIWCLRKFGSDHIDRDMPDPNDSVDVIICGNEGYTPLIRGRETGVESPFVKGAFLEMLLTTVE